MATVSDITAIPFSGLNHIDALLDKGPDWNFLSNSNANVLYYTFSTASGNEPGKFGQEMFSFAQQAAARTAFDYLQQVTGIAFVETNAGTAAQIHLAKMDLAGQYTTGLCSWLAGYRSYPDGTLTEYTANAYVYLDHIDWGHITNNLTPGTQGYETLLHELGHAIGLKHPFAESAGDVALPGHEDNTANTIMSYTNVGGPYSTFQPYDIAALNWLYGGDGLRGALGMNGSGARYLTGTSKSETLVGTGFNDIFQGNGGNDMIHGGEGRDTAIFGGNYGNYRFTNLANGDLAVIGAEGETTLNQIDVLQFADMRVERADVAASDTAAPAAPVISVTQNAAGYTSGNRPIFTGAAEAGATVKVYIGQQLVASAVADANGLWSARPPENAPLADRMGYSATASATDAAGNVSSLSTPIVFNVDATPPAAPTVTANLISGGNQPVFAGTGEAGSTIQIIKAGDWIEIGRATVGANGQWQLNSAPLPNGNYQVTVSSVDRADNATSAQQSVTLAINNALNQTGTAGNDTFAMAPGSAAIQGGAGLDTAVYSGVSDSFVLERGVYGFMVRDSAGAVDNLINVERIKFDDTMVALDINGSAGQIYRLYQAAFDRVPDGGGLAFWINRTDQGDSLMQIAKYFAMNQEYIDLYANTSNEQFVTKLYEHVLDRAPEGGGYDFWVGNLNTGATNRDEVLTLFSESPENQAQVIGSIVNGIEYPFPLA
ncbi:DUF4214 domain-containing protein [Telluria beijingensis]|uniref:DUF4214 domain-containing protein n=1 Tax=Telluria beijingensis TaxID=3068633 RepID=UPI0027955F11|nr:DUF4214 domain-containing protein [Massilia sp. REN29]